MKPKVLNQIISPNHQMDEKLRLQRIETRNKLIKMCMFSFTFMIIEFIGGVYSNSIAIISDAIHMGSDVIGYSMQLLASILALQPASEVYSFGKQRAELVGGLFNCFVIWTLTAYLLFQSVKR
jgi:cation diffusion facilitator family transporter